MNREITQVTEKYRPGLMGACEEAVRKAASEQIRSFVGEKPADLIGSMMAAERKGGSLPATIIGAGALVVGATGAFGQLQDSLNTIWGVTPKPGKSLWAFVRDRFLSMAMVLICETAR